MSDQILADDKAEGKKQRHTAKRIRLRFAVIVGSLENMVLVLATNLDDPQIIQNELLGRQTEGGGKFVSPIEVGCGFISRGQQA